MTGRFKELVVGATEQDGVGEIGRDCIINAGSYRTCEGALDLILRTSQ